MTDIRTLVAQCRLDGPVELSGGGASSVYYDLRPLSLHPVNGPNIGRMLWRLLAAERPEFIAAPALGGIPLAVHTAAAGGVPALMVRSEAKRHGMGRQIEGESCAGRRVAVVDDVATSGHSLLAAGHALYKAGADVIGYAVILDRSPCLLGIRSLVTLAQLEARDD